MSTQQGESVKQPIESKSDLIDWFAAGEKTRTDWRIGTEHEKFPFRLGSFAPIEYCGEGGIRHLLEELIRRHAWEPIFENSNIIALRRAGTQAVISLEPGGQLELSGAPLMSLHETYAEIAQHLEEVRAIGEDIGMGFAGLGHAPTWGLDETPVMPKGRYAIMKRYMPTVGQLGLDMMFRTATVQVNLDFENEADMVLKFRTALALQPIVSAIFANSPFRDSKVTGMQSARCNVWLDTDAARSGIPQFVFEAGMGYERYVDYALDVPMYFVYRDGRYIDVSGKSFKQFMEGKLPELPGERPSLSDWADHLSTLFPDVRLKRYLEMRGADSGDIDHLTALPALWTGILYDQDALGECWDLVKGLSHSAIEKARADVPVQGLDTLYGNRTMLSMARDILRAACDGLSRRGLKDPRRRDETTYLRCLQATVASGLSPAQLLLMRYQNGWNNDVERVWEATVL